MVLIALYALSASGTPDKKPELSEAISLLLAANGVAASIRLFVVVFTAESLSVLSGTDKLYLTVGAIGTMWVSVGTIGRTFAGLNSEVEDEPASQEESK